MLAYLESIGRRPSPPRERVKNRTGAEGCLINANRTNRATQVSAIIPSFNNEETITVCLESVISNGPDELIVVDGGSTDRTLELASAFREAKILTGVEGIAKAKDVGWRTSEGELVLFLDADAYMVPNTVDVLRSYLSGTEIAGVSCRIGCANVHRLLPRLRDFDFRLAYEEQFKTGNVVDCVTDPTICGLFRRAALEDVNGFDLDYPYAEDLKLLQKLRSKEYRVLMVYEPCVYHYHREGWRDVLRQLYHHGIGKGILIEETRQESYSRKKLVKLTKQFLRNGPKAGSSIFLAYPFFRLATEAAFFIGYLRGRSLGKTIRDSRS